MIRLACKRTDIKFVIAEKNGVTTELNNQAQYRRPKLATHSLTRTEFGLPGAVLGFNFLNEHTKYTPAVSPQRLRSN